MGTSTSFHVDHRGWGGWVRALLLLKVPTLNLRVGVPGVEFSEVVF